MESPEAVTVVDEASLPFEGRWNRLISTTNWEKGQIIFQWRRALKAAKAPATEYSDEAWSRRVSSVTGQHVGRLRRVYERFGEVHEQFEGLYWSHFQAALDWDDAEMWLEGAIQKHWSVSHMRRFRWETLGSPEDLKPRDEDLVVAELNEDIESREDQVPPMVESTINSVEDERSPAGPDFGDADDDPLSAGGKAGANIDSGTDHSTVPFVRPFENLAELPGDLAEAFEAFKLSIIRHKADQWQAISLEDVLGALEALKELALIPTVSEQNPL